MPVTRVPKTQTINDNIFRNLNVIMTRRADGSLGTLRLTRQGKIKTSKSSTNRVIQWALKRYDKARGKYVSDKFFKSKNYATRREQFKLQDYINKVRTATMTPYMTSDDEPYMVGDYSALIKKGSLWVSRR